MGKLASALIIWVFLPITAFANSWQNTLVVLIGSSDYDNAPSLDFVNNDLDAMASYARNGLGVPQEQVHVLREATLTDYLQVFSEGGLIDREARRLQANVLVYVSSHGLPNSSGDSSLLPKDGIPSISATLFKQSDILRALERAKSQVPSDRTFLALFDACFSGKSRVGQVSDAKAPPLNPVRDLAAFNVLSAATGDSVAFADRTAQLSGLTSAFLRAVSGQADEAAFGGNDDGQVSSDEVQAFIGRTIGAITLSDQKTEANFVEELIFPPFLVGRLYDEVEKQRLEALWRASNLGTPNVPTIAQTVKATSDEDLLSLYRQYDKADISIQAFESRCGKSALCAPYENQLAIAKHELDSSYFRLEDQKAWIEETLRDRTERCQGYLASCERLRGLDPSYSCIHQRRAKRECSFLEADAELFGDDSNAMTQQRETQSGDIASSSADLDNEVVVASITDSAPSDRQPDQGKPDCDYPFNDQCLSKRDFVKEIQSKLIGLGCTIGSVDGIPGTKTLGAIVQMQQSMDVASSAPQTADEWNQILQLVRKARPYSCSCLTNQQYSRSYGCICQTGYHKANGKCEPRPNAGDQQRDFSHNIIGKRIRIKLIALGRKPKVCAKTQVIPIKVKKSGSIHFPNDVVRYSLNQSESIIQFNSIGASGTINLKTGQGYGSGRCGKYKVILLSG